MKFALSYGLAVATAIAFLTSPTTSAQQGGDRSEASAHRPGETAAEVPEEAVAVLLSTQGNNARGIVHLKQQGEAIQVRGKVINLAPGKHGFHIHQYGDLRAADGTSAGGHYAPEGHPHGGPDDPKRHAGDLGNIVAGDDGVATIDMKINDLKLHFVIGRSLVVHQGEDDFKSQPSGDAGPRVALGVIGFANVETTDEP